MKSDNKIKMYCLKCKKHNENEVLEIKKVEKKNKSKTIVYMAKGICPHESCKIANCVLINKEKAEMYEKLLK